MENTLTNFMLETILKLQSLTDVKVFLLIDCAQKRRYCGSKNLMDAFQGEMGLFRSTDTDIAVHLDPAANALIESSPPNSSFSAVDKDSNNRGQSSSDFESYASSVEPLPLSVDAPSSAFPLPKVGWKSKRHDDQATSFADIEGEGPTKVKQTKMEDPGEENGALNSEDACKKELVDNLEEIPEYVISDDEEDDSATVSFLMDDTNISISPFDATIQSHGIVERDCNRISTKYPFIEPMAFFDSLTSNDLEVHKYSTLMNVENPVALYQKGTVESKLLKSVCYSVGKNAALKCPYPFTAQNKSALLSHWSHHCDLFVGQCANAGLLVEKTHKNTTMLNLIPRMSPVGHIRQSIRDGFKRVAKQCQKSQ